MKFLKALICIFFVFVALSALLTALVRQPILFAIIAGCSFGAWMLYKSVMADPKLQKLYKSRKTWE